MLNNLENRLSPKESELCEGLFTLNELHEAATGMPHGKTPGHDGFPIEFYLKFWSKLGPPLLNELLNEAFSLGHLSSSQQIGLIRLIHKKNDKVTRLKNWRPISLLNTDYKIAAKALANRLRKVLESVVNTDQTGSVPGRTITDNLNLMRDIFDETA